LTDRNEVVGERAMRNKELAKIFSRIADAIEFKGGDRFRIIAYRRAAATLEDLTEDIETVAEESRLEELQGVGKAIASKIKEYLKTGRIQKYDEEIENVPEELLDLLVIQDLGPKTLALAYKKLDVRNLTDLKKTISDGTLAELPRMGKQKVKNIKKSIEIFEKSRERIPISEAVQISEKIVKYLKSYQDIKQVIPAGSLRRMKETVGDIDILATGIDGEKIIDYFIAYPYTERVIASGDTKGSILVQTDRETRQIDLRILPQESFGAALQYFTGSKEHNIKLRRIAREKGLKINEYGVFQGKNRIAGRTEEEVYKAVGLPYIPPELREDRGEIEVGYKGEIPKLIDIADIKGDLHVHSDYSDGTSTLQEIAEFAKSLNYKYVAICDHSKSVNYAGGLSEEKLRRQMIEIERLNTDREVKMLKGTEVDILKNGDLDFPDEILEELDLVVAAVHLGFKYDVTDRIIKAIENPNVDIIAHPSGRLISRREGYEVDLEAVIKRARKYNKILELNAYPDRLDLDDKGLRRTKEAGVRVSIGTDAHTAAEMRWMRFGVGTARRGWLERDDVINTQDEVCLPSRKNQISSIPNEKCY
jgi:DNA polymerase (family 10)